MKKIKLAMAVTVLAVGAVLFTACKKTEGPQGPAGPQGSPGVVATSTDGFFKGTLTGTHRDGSVINESFNFTSYWGGPACTLDSIWSGFIFNMSRGTDILSSNSAYFSINTPSLTNFSAASSSLDFTYVRALSSNKQFYFNVYGLSPAISGVSYNKTTGQLTGSYNITIPGTSNPTGNTATLSGTFQTSVTQNYYRLAHH